MGLLWRLFAPKPLKKARRAVHPGRMLEDAIVRGARGKRRKRRKRRASAPMRPRQPNYQGSFAMDGTEYICHHKHRTPEAAAECGRRLARQKAKELGLEPPTFT